VYHEDDKGYYLLSMNVIDRINGMYGSAANIKHTRLAEDTKCNWAVTASELRCVLRYVTTVTDAMNLTRLILSIKGPIRLSGLSCQNMIAISGVWYDLKPQFRTALEEQGITDGTFILQGV